MLQPIITFLAAVLLAATAPAHAQVPAILYFDLSWCPRPEEISQLSRFMNITKSGCCIGQALVFSEYRASSELKEKWGHRFSARSNFNDACTGRVLSEAEQVTDDETRRKVAVRDATAAEAAERQRSIDEAQEELARRAGAPRFIGGLSKDDLCVAVGTTTRHSTVPGIGTFPELLGLVKKEIARRNLRMDGALIEKERIRLGISECQLFATWGPPQSQRRSVGSWGVHIQHVYSGGRLVYTENGRVTAWQD